DSFFFSSRRRHTRWPRDWSSDVCSSDLLPGVGRSTAAPVTSLPPFATPVSRAPDSVIVLGPSLLISITRLRLAGSDSAIAALNQIGRASCRERGESSVVAGSLKDARVML